MTITQFFADGSLVIIALAGVVLATRGFPWSEWKRVLPHAIMAGLTSLLIGKLMSLVYQPQVQRPFIEKGLEAGAAYIHNPGFPSDHALLGTVIIMAVVVLTPYKKTAFVLALLGVMMCVARVVAQVHTPLDIVGGVGAGLIGALWYVKLRQPVSFQ